VSVNGSQFSSLNMAVNTLDEKKLNGLNCEHGHTQAHQTIRQPAGIGGSFWRYKRRCKPMGKGWGNPGCSGVAAKGWAGKAPTGPLMRFTEARNDKPPAGMRGGLTRQGGCLYARVAVRRSSSVARLIPLSTYLYASAFLDGETTRRTGLNLDRGGQPLDTRREAGKREWHRETGKSCPQRMAPSVIKSHDPVEASFRLNRADSPSVIGFYR
jgi:hypothetical protein